MSPWILATAVAALLLLAAIRIQASARRYLLVGSLILGGVVTVALVDLGSRANGYYPNSRALRLAKQVGIDLAEAARNPSVSRVILVEGSSYTARGLDGAMMARLLSRGSATRTSVVQMSLDGANHFERTWLLGIALDQLARRDVAALEHKEVILLLEIQRGYDFAPMNGFVRNLRTWRTYAYMTPGNSLNGLRAVGSLDGRAPESVVELLVPATEHAMVNGLGIGMARRGVSLSELDPVGGYQPLRSSKRGYRHGEGMKDVLHRAQEMRGSTVTPVERLSWVEDIRIRRYRALLGGMLDSMAFFAIPSTETEDLEHVSAFCARVRDMPCLEYRDPALLKRLQRRPDWNDARHMRVSGAEKFTRWFARRFMRDVMGEQEA